MHKDRYVKIAATILVACLFGELILAANFMQMLFAVVGAASVVFILSRGATGEPANADDFLRGGVLYRVLWRRPFPTPRQWGGQYVVQEVGNPACLLIESSFELYDFFEVEKERGRITLVRDRTSEALRERHVDTHE
jgi:hypothetical protein